MTRFVVLVSLILIVACGKKELTLQTFSTGLQQGAEIDSIYSRALRNFDAGKQERKRFLIDSAKMDFRHLANQYNHRKSLQKITEIDNFFTNFLSINDSLAQNAKSRNLIFTAAGHFKRILYFFPDNKDAKQYLDQNKADIEKRLKQTLDRGKLYLRQRRTTASKRNFNLVLNYDPENAEALSGLQQVAAKERQIRAENARKQKEKVAEAEKNTLPKLSASEKEKLYLLGIDAYKKQDYLKAFEYFESITDSTYKDTQQYLNLSKDKISDQEE